MDPAMTEHPAQHHIHVSDCSLPSDSDHEVAQTIHVEFHDVMEHVESYPHTPVAVAAAAAMTVAAAAVADAAAAVAMTSLLRGCLDADASPVQLLCSPL